MTEPRPAYDPGKDNKPKQVYFRNRRNKVAELLTQGKSYRQIAAELDISRSTVQRDAKWLETNEHLLRAHDMADEVVDGEFVEQAIIPLPNPIPTNVQQHRTQRQKAVVQLLQKKKTYREIADELGYDVSTIVQDVNQYLAEYGDWGGRTMLEHRNEQLLWIDEELKNLQADMNMEPIRAINADGDESPGWDLSPYQAGVVRDKARKRAHELMVQKSRLLNLLVQQHKIEKEEKVAVVAVRGVDFDKWKQIRGE